MDKNKCNSCGEKKCSCKNKNFTKSVVEINNPGCITLMRKVDIPASMGDDTAVPPVIGKYRNVLLYYEANNRAYLYSSDGIPTKLNNGITDYEDAINLPQINGVTLRGDKSAADLGLDNAPMIITVATGNTSWSGADTAEDVYNFFLNKGKVNIVFNGGENYAYEVTSAAYIPEEEKMMCMVTAATATTVEETTEFDGNALFGTMTLYTADKAIDVSQIELQPKLFVTDFTGLDLNYNELSGVPATNASIGMVKPGTGIAVDSSGTISINASDFQSDWDEADPTAPDYIKNKPTISPVNDATLTIQQNGDEVATFTANSSTDTVANITSPTITLTDTDPGEGSPLQANHFIGVYGDDPIVLDYSTTEVDTGCKWINGESIYKITVDIGNLPNNTTGTVAHGIADLGQLVELKGSFTDGTNSAPLPYSSPTTSKNVQVYVDATDITIITGEDRSSYTGYVTVYYTKRLY